MTRIAVVDVETTGLNPYRHDRIVELAAVVVDIDGTVSREFVTLVNPGRDMGPTHIHGLTTEDVIDAPRFGEIAGALLEVLDDCVALASHNVRFDYSFLAAEFLRLGCTFPDCRMLCTMQLAGGGSLSSVCGEYGIAVEGNAHSALHDARAAAEILCVLLADAPRLVSEISAWSPIAWPDVPKSPVAPLTRGESRKVGAPTYLQRLLACMPSDALFDDDDSAIAAYFALLDRALEDRYIDEAEGEDLVQIATHWSISGDGVARIHRDYLLRLGATALADGVITGSERRDLLRVATLLGVQAPELDVILAMAASKLGEVSSRQPVVDMPCNQDLAGKRVCFTGECQCRMQGEPITRERAIELAVSRGLLIAESVTKKLDLLVVADPLSQSGKAKKARQYGIRVMHEPVFWQALGMEVE